MRGQVLGVVHAYIHACEILVLGEGPSSHLVGQGRRSSMDFMVTFGTVCLFDSLGLPTRGLDYNNHSLLKSLVALPLVALMPTEHCAHHGLEA